MSDAEGRFRDLEAAERPTFKIIVRAERNNESEAIRGLRWLLKAAGRGYGLRCLSVTEINQGTEKR